MQTKFYHNVLDKDLFKKYQNLMMSLNLDNMAYNKELGRYTLTCLTAAKDGNMTFNSVYDIKDLESNLIVKEENKHLDDVIDITYDIHKDLWSLAKETFQSETLLPSYAIICLYKEDGNLEMHKDFASNKYVLDFCLYQKHPWDFYVEDEKFSMEENDIVAFWGEDQVHGRKDYPNPKENIVCNIMFVYAEPDSWFFTSPIEHHAAIKKIRFKNLHGLGHLRQNPKNL